MTNGGITTLKIFLGYLAIMAIGITVLTVMFVRDRREANEALAKAEKEMKGDTDKSHDK